MQKLYEMKEQLLTLVYEENTQKWNKVVTEATECYGNPSKFWKRIKYLLASCGSEATDVSELE